MSTEAYEDLLQRAQSELTLEERHRLAEQLSDSGDAIAAPNGGRQATKSLYEALDERGMIGSIPEGPGDLSTNPEYLRGFGQDGD